jgi:hypothetical protein
MTRRADEMKVARVAELRLEARAAVAEFDLPRNAGADHPLKGAVDRGAADAGRLAAHVLEKIVGAEMTFLA